MKLPDAFIEEYHAMRSRFSWVAQQMEAESADMAGMRSAAEDIRDFVTRWKGTIGIPEIEAGLENMERMTGGIESHLTQIRTLHIIEVIEARRDLLVAEQFFKLSQSYIKMMKSAPPELKPTLENAYREHMGGDYDPEKEFRESEAELDDAEARFNDVMRELSEDWPEAVTPEFRARLLDLDAHALDAWKGELVSEVQALESGG